MFYFENVRSNRFKRITIFKHFILVNHHCLLTYVSKMVSGMKFKAVVDSTRQISDHTNLYIYTIHNHRLVIEPPRQLNNTPLRYEEAP